jgi:hypothetical protein
MKRLFAAIALTAALVLGGFGGTPTADAHPVSASTTYAICSYHAAGTGWSLVGWRTIHYGSAHVTQCHERLYGPGYTLNQCWQYVWNIPDPYWLPYSPPCF